MGCEGFQGSAWNLNNIRPYQGLQIVMSSLIAFTLLAMCFLIIPPLAFKQGLRAYRGS